MNTLSNVKSKRDEQDSLYIGFTSNVLPEASSSKTGVSTQNAHMRTTQIAISNKTKEIPHWYALRST